MYLSTFKDVNSEQNTTILENAAGIAMNEAGISENSVDISSLRVSLRISHLMK